LEDTRVRREKKKGNPQGRGADSWTSNEDMGLAAKKWKKKSHFRVGLE